MKKLGNWIKKDIVLFAALLFAALSALVIRPDGAYLHYIDYRTISILFCLMTVMAGLKEMGVFGRMARGILRRAVNRRQVFLVLLFLCFFFSMLITNDVALITFVPLTILVFDMLGEEEREKWMVPVVVMQTIAANLGSMLTPVGNPQNLYLYGLSGMGLRAFIKLMLPYTAAALVMLVLWVLWVCRGDKKGLEIAFDGGDKEGQTGKVVLYAVLFVLSLLSVFRVLPYGVPLAAVSGAVLLFDRKVFRKVDYALLLTFCGFFVFIGNMGRVEPFRALLERVIAGHEAVTAAGISQLISNVPAALLLSGFTEDVSALIVGTNLGGLGTLIASMASLISFKYIAARDGSAKGRYLACFTAANVLFFAVLFALYYALSF